MPNLLWIGIGWLAVGVGAVGVVLPLLPTTPFLLVAAWAFARSSPRFRDWLLNHRHFGPLIRAWREDGAIPLSAKVIATGTIAASAVWVVALSGLSAVLIVSVTLFLFCVVAFIVSRPTAKRTHAS